MDAWVETMTLPTGNPNELPNSRSVRGAFTLIELILVMALLSVVLMVIAPSLGNFFRGRTLDSEARRLLTLTRYGKSRAISEGVPMVLWLDPKLPAYGLVQEATYATYDPKALYYRLSPDLEIDVERTARAVGTIPILREGVQPSRSAFTIRFFPDGSVGEGSPRNLWLRQKNLSRVRVSPADEIWISETLDHRNYEIQTNLLASPRR